MRGSVLSDRNGGAALEVAEATAGCAAVDGFGWGFGGSIFSPMYRVKVSRLMVLVDDIERGRINKPVSGRLRLLSSVGRALPW